MEEGAGYLDDAIRNFKLYLVASPYSVNVQAIQDKIFAREVKIVQK